MTPTTSSFPRGLCIKALLLSLFFTSAAFAHFDLFMAASSRTYPSLGGEVEIESGYNQLLWGQAGDKSPFFGLLRPSLSLLSSGVINAYNAKFELFPVSFIGLVAGHEEVQSDYDEFTYFDCQEIRCKGSTKRDYIQLKMALSAGPLIMSGLIENARNSYSEGEDPLQPPGEYRHIVLANPKFDNHYRSNYFLGLKTSAGTIGALTEYVVFEKSEEYNRTDLLLFNKRINQWSLTAGAGSFESSQAARGLMGVFFLTYYFIPSSKLF